MAGAYSLTNLIYCRVLMRFADSLTWQTTMHRAASTRGGLRSCDLAGRSAFQSESNFLFRCYRTLVIAKSHQAGLTLHG